MIRHRAQTTTHVTVIDIGLQGHRGYYAELACEIEYTRSPISPMRLPSFTSPGEPAEGGEVEITDIRPFRMIKRPEGRPLSGALLEKQYLTPVPDWLDAMIRECIDTDLLTGDE